MTAIQQSRVRLWLQRFIRPELMRRSANAMSTIFGGDLSNMSITRLCGRALPVCCQKSSALMHSLKWFALSLVVLLLAGPAARAGEGDLAIPDLHEGFF